MEDKLLKHGINKRTYNDFLQTYKIAQNHELKRYEGYVNAAQDIFK